MLLAHGTTPSQPPWAWDPHPDVMIVMVLLVAAYAVAITRFGPRLVEAGEPVINLRQLMLLASALGALWVFSAWPIHNLAEGFSYTVHMVQHTVYTLIVPPLLILGTPVWLWRWVLGRVLPVFRFLVRPAVAVTAYSVVAGATHLPVLADSAVTSGPSHLAQHILLVATAFLAWWPLTSRVPGAHRLTWPPWRLVYLFSIVVVPSIAGSFLIYAQATVYRAYEPYPHLFGLSTLEDQRTGGVVMEWAEAVVLFGVMGFEFVRLAVHELRQPRAGGQNAEAGAAP